MFHGDNRELAGDYGRLALEFDQVQLADRLLAAADNSMHPTGASSRTRHRARQAGQVRRGHPLLQPGFVAGARPTFDLEQPCAGNCHGSLLAAIRARAGRASPGAPRPPMEPRPKSGRTWRSVLGLQGKYDEAKLIAARDIPMETTAENTSFLRQVVKLEPKTMPSTVDKSIDVAEAPIGAIQTVQGHVGQGRAGG